MDIGRYFLIIVIVLIPLVIWLLRKVYRFEKVRFVRRRAAAQAVRDASNADPQLVRKRIALSVIVVILCVVSYVVVRY
jgi:flagellar biogenesis protein FliO